MGLRIQVNEQNGMAQFGQASAQRQAGGGFGHAAFLVANGNSGNDRWLPFLAEYAIRLKAQTTEGEDRG